MATDFAPYANLRLFIPQPAATPEDLRSGVPVSTAHWLIEAFVKAEQATGRSMAETPTLDPSKRVLAGFVTAWAEVPEETDWLSARSAFTWDETGLAPAGLMAGMAGLGILGVLDDLPTLSGHPQRGQATVMGLSGLFGSGGIGAELRTQTGDAISVELHVTT